MVIETLHHTRNAAHITYLGAHANGIIQNTLTRIVFNRVLLAAAVMGKGSKAYHYSSESSCQQETQQKTQQGEHAGASEEPSRPAGRSLTLASPERLTLC
jgi:hypothetical protein